MSSPVASIHGVDREHELINAIAGQTTPKLRLDRLDEGLKINAAGNGVREGLHLSMLNRIPFLRAEPEPHLDRRPRPIIFGASHLEPLKAAFALRTGQRLRKSSARFSVSQAALPSELPIKRTTASRTESQPCPPDVPGAIPQTETEIPPQRFRWAQPADMAWCRLQGSNPRPPDYKSGALPSELNRQQDRVYPKTGVRQRDSGRGGGVRTGTTGSPRRPDPAGRRGRRRWSRHRAPGTRRP